MSVDIRKEDHIGWVELNRPETKNALDPESLFQLCDAWREFGEDDDVRVVVVASKVRDSFCSGLDMNSTLPIFTGARPPQSEAEKRLTENPMAMFEGMLREAQLAKPVISAINGYCFTGGWELAMATDIRIASEDAVFQMREAKYAIMPTSGGTVRLPRMIPYAHAMWVLLSGEMVTAAKLYEWGFLNRVVPYEELHDTAAKMAGIIAANGPLAVRCIKETVRTTLGMPMAEALIKEMEIGSRVAMSEDAKEGPRAFKEKRPPEFKGK